MIITIDGPIATGKSTIAKKLANEIGFIFFDTGAMYRCFTHFLLKRGIDIGSRELVIRQLKEFDFSIKIKQGNKLYIVNGEDVTQVIRGAEVTRQVSQVAAIKEVREELVAMQREYARGINAVFEGRDMGTVVFPDAEIKVFLKADPAIRGKRRYDEIMEKYPNDFQGITLEQMIEDISRRDEVDSTREVSPLKKADDAFVIDTSHLTIDEVIVKILEYKESKPIS